eukprot:285027-Rhodomonas_salina.2
MRPPRYPSELSYAPTPLLRDARYCDTRMVLDLSHSPRRMVLDISSGPRRVVLYIPYGPTYAPATRCPVLTEHILLSAHASAMRWYWHSVCCYVLCDARNSHRRICYGVSGTDLCVWHYQDVMLEGGVMEDVATGITLRAGYAMSGTDVAHGS